MSLLRKRGPAFCLDGSLTAVHALTEARHRLLQFSSENPQPHNQKRAKNMILSDDAFIEEAVLAENIAVVDKPLVFVAGVKNHIFDISGSVVQTFHERGTSVLFRNKSDHESFLASDPCWNQEQYSYLNHVGRNDDDTIYGFCQDLTMSMCNSIDFDFDQKFAADFTTMKEAISLAAADVYTTLLRTGVMLIETCRENSYDTVFIMGPAISFSMALHCLLQSNGVRSSIIPPSHLKQITIDVHKDWYKRNNIISVVKVPKRYVDITTEAENVTKGMTGANIVGLFRAKDPVYFQNIGCLVEDSNHHFALIDRFIDDEIEQKFQDMITRDPIAYNLHVLTSYIHFLKEDESKGYKRNIVDGLASMKDAKFEFGSYKIDRTFMFHGISAFTSCIVRAIFYLRVFHIALQQSKISCVIVSPARSLEARGATEAARRAGIISYELQCGTITSSRRFWRPNVDFVLCSDPVSKNIYQDFFKSDPSSILLVGSPRLDKNIAPYREAAKNADLKNLNIFLALQTLATEISVKMIHACVDALADIKGSTLTVAFHPRESDRNKTYLRQLLNELPIDVSIVEGDSLSHLVHHNVCVTYFSFLGVEAFGVGCNVVALNLTGNDWPFRLAELGVAREALSTAELTSIFSDFHKHKESKVNVSGTQTNSASVLRDGKSMERINTLINQHILPASQTNVVPARQVVDPTIVQPPKKISWLHKLLGLAGISGTTDHEHL